MQIQSVTASESVKALLSANALPIDDLDDPSIMMWGAYDGEQLLGVIGLQRLDGVGLLRSLAVTGSARSRGVAAHLCERVFEVGREKQLAQLWLLTTSARDYFIRHGFAQVARDSAPPAIRATAQFTALCPSSACVMRRTLTTDA